MLTEVASTRTSFVGVSHHGLMADYIVDCLVESRQISQVQLGTWPFDRVLSSNHEEHLWAEAESRPNRHEM